MCERFGAGCLNPTTTISVENSLLGMNSFRPEPHVAQQSRRDKLRVPPAPATHHHILSNHLPVLNPDSEINPGLNQVRDVRNCNSLFEPAMLPSGILDLSGNEASFANPLPSSFNGSSNNLTSAKVGDPQNPSFWKGMGSQPSCDWIMNYMGSGGSAPIQTPMFASHLYLKPGFSGYQDVQSPLNNTPSELSTQCSQKQYGELHFTSPPFYQNALQEVVVTSSSTSVGNQGLEMASLVQQNVRETSSPCSWVDGGNELLLLPNPNFGNPTNAGVWMSRQSHQWSGEEDFVRNRSEGGYGVVDGTATTQGLSLSLSSKPLLELQVAQFEERFGHEELESRSCIVEGSQSFKMNDVGFLSPHSISNRGYGNSAQGIVGAAMDARRGVGPLGPFTGYATILKSSKFLKPAQQLLEEFCNVISGPKLLKQCETTERSFGSAGVSYDTVVGENEIGRLGNSVAASSSFNSSTERVLDKGACQVHGPEFQHKKAKLLYMQEEVCRRYKQYHQQMQMVVSSFESVAGLSSATPYTSLALKAVSKHFRCLKNAISNQLRHISKVLGEEFMSSPGSSGGEMMVTPRLKFIDQNLQKQKAGENSIGFLDHNQPVWRPQRGLPERAVGVLRAWLFEHFLHPYPTDTDKHMLANQTGLSRNQVSNWFINARVRLWKPMVEEIHMLETKGITEMDLNSAKNDGKPVSDSGLQPPVGKSLEDQTNNSVISDESMEQWHREKRSRMEECVVPTSMDGGLMGFAPYQRGIEIGGLGAVSLTLGLRHNDGAMGVQQQQQQIRRHFGSQMVHDFVA